MVRTTINRLVEKWPEGGIAIHGTTYGNLHSIKRNGIVKGNPYVCPFPSKNGWKKYGKETQEILERSIGSTLFAGRYALSKMQTANRETDEKDLPAIVILKGKTTGEFLEGYDENDPQYKNLEFGTKTYRSFGKSPEHGIPANRIAGIVKITQGEYIEIMRKASDPGEAKALIKSRLAMKTLLAIRKIVEHHREKTKK